MAFRLTFVRVVYGSVWVGCLVAAFWGMAARSVGLVFSLCFGRL